MKICKFVFDANMNIFSLTPCCDLQSNDDQHEMDNFSVNMLQYLQAITNG